MKGEIISVGTEILLGDIIDTNSQFIAQRLAALGIDVFYLSSVGDNLNLLEEILKTAYKRSDLIIITGGLGPTQDDITKEALCNVLDIPLYTDRNEIIKLENFFQKRGLEMPPNNLRQALLPENAIVLNNNYGTASGLIVSKDDKYFILLPGPPEEMTDIFKNHLVPWLQENIATHEYTLQSHTLKFVGISESKLAKELHDLIKSQTKLTMALYAKVAEVHLRLTAKVRSQAEFFKLLKPLKELILKRVGDFYYGSDDQSLPEVVGDLLRNRKLTIATGESCTGGLLAKYFTDVPGSSKFFLGGVVAYDNAIKERILAVPKEILATEGAVSEKTAIAMARGVKDALQSDIGIATTGIAGPGGGSSSKPVGLVYISVIGENINICEKCVFSGGRDDIRRKAAFWALNLLKRSLEEV